MDDLARFEEAATLWSVDYRNAADLVTIACDMLANDHDGPNLAILAGVRLADADLEVPGLLEAALHDLGLPFNPRGSQAAREAGLVMMATRTLDGRMTPRDLTAWAHSTFGHDFEPAARLADLDDIYDIFEYETMTEAELNAEVLTEAQAIVTHGSLA